MIDIVYLEKEDCVEIVFFREKEKKIPNYGFLQYVESTRRPYVSVFGNRSFFKSFEVLDTTIFL